MQCGKHWSMYLFRTECHDDSQCSKYRGVGNITGYLQPYVGLYHDNVTPNTRGVSGNHAGGDIVHCGGNTPPPQPLVVV